MEPRPNAKRAAVIEAARKAVTSGAWGKTTLVALGKQAGVSRQHIHNLFNRSGSGAKDGIARELVLDECLRLVRASLKAMEGEDTYRNAIHAAVLKTLTERREGLLSMIAEDSNFELLPHVSVKSGEALSVGMQMAVE